MSLPPYFTRCSWNREKRADRANQRGSQIVEFAAAIVLLVVFVFIPLLDFSIVPVRWMMAAEIVKDYTRQLAFCESFKQSYRLAENDSSLSTRLNTLGGIKVQSVHLCLRIERIFRPGEVLLVEQPGKIPKSWLPYDGAAPATYTLLLEVRLQLSPALLLGSRQPALPGVTVPFPMLVTASHEWANMGVNPETGNFFLNE